MRSPRTTRVGQFVAGAMAITMGLVACSSSDPDPVASGGGSTFVGLRGSAPVLLRAEQSCDRGARGLPVVRARGVRRQLLRGAGATGRCSPRRVPPSAARPLTPRGRSRPARRPSPTPATTTSDTNTQEEGIDEPDVVETDGDFVYLVDQDQLVILDGATAAVVSRTPLAGLRRPAPAVG